MGWSLREGAGGQRTTLMCQHGDDVSSALLPLSASLRTAQALSWGVRGVGTCADHRPRVRREGVRAWCEELG